MSIEVLFVPRRVTKSECVHYLILSGVWSPLATSCSVVTDIFGPPINKCTLFKDTYNNRGRFAHTFCGI